MAESRKSTSSTTSQSGGSRSAKSGRDSSSGSKAASGQSGSGGDSMAELSKQGQEAVSQAQEAVSQAQDQAVKLVGMAREQATTQVTTQKERAAGMLGALGTALHDASREVRKQDDAPIADYIDMAADQVEQIAGMLKEQDIGQLIDTAQQFARRQPILFLAAAIAVGFVGARFIKSSAQSGDEQGSFADSSSGESSRYRESSQFGSLSSSKMETPGYSGGPGARRQ